MKKLRLMNHDSVKRKLPKNLLEVYRTEFEEGGIFTFKDNLLCIDWQKFKEAEDKKLPVTEVLEVLKIVSKSVTGHWEVKNIRRLEGPMIFGWPRLLSGSQVYFKNGRDLKNYMQVRHINGKLKVRATKVTAEMDFSIN